MRKFNQSHQLLASAQRVIDLITSEDYLRYRYEDPQLMGFKLDISRDDEQAFACSIERVVDPGDKLPGVARRLVGDRFSVVQTTDWSRQGPPFKGTMKVTIPGMPGSITNNLLLSEVDDQCSCIETHGNIEVRIPLAGGQIERMLGGVAEETFAVSMRTINEYIARKK